MLHSTISATSDLVDICFVDHCGLGVEASPVRADNCRKFRNWSNPSPWLCALSSLFENLMVPLVHSSDTRRLEALTGCEGSIFFICRSQRSHHWADLDRALQEASDQGQSARGAQVWITTKATRSDTVIPNMLHAPHGIPGNEKH